MMSYLFSANACVRVRMCACRMYACMHACVHVCSEHTYAGMYVCMYVFMYVMWCYVGTLCCLVSSRFFVLMILYAFVRAHTGIDRSCLETPTRARAARSR